MTGAASASPPPGPPLADQGAPFIGEERATFTSGDILRRAAAVAAALPTGSLDAVVVRSSSAAFVAAAMLAAWRRGVAPVLLDPALKDEPTAVRQRFPAVVTVSDRSDEVGAVVVSEAAATPLAVDWPADEQTAVQFFTSGSTGEPKLVKKLARQLYRQLEREIAWLGVDHGVTVLSMVPPFHILGFVYGLVLPLLGRGSTCFLHGAAPARWVDHLERERPRVVVGVPSHYRFLVASLERPLPEALYLSSGSPLSPAVHEAFVAGTGQMLTQIYGSTETGGIAKRRGFGPWLPFPGLEWASRVEDGRLEVRAPWQDEPELWTVTDDVVAPEGNGFVLLGRTDSVVKVGGKRFSTNEVIQQAQALPGVDGAVAVVYERYTENAVALYLTPAAGASLDEAAVRAALAARLASFKVPRTIRVLDHLPLLANGKVDLARLTAMATAARTA